MAIQRTYYCGPHGHARRLTNLTGLWIVIDTPNVQVDLNDIKSDPTNPDKVFAIGTNNSIYVSTNAGNTWNIPGGGYLAYPAAEWHEIWPIDANNIVAVGSLGLVAVSADGGLTFGIPNPIAFPATGSVRAVHFISPLIGIVGYENIAALTIDGGLTWTQSVPLFSTVPGVISLINGVHLDQTGTVAIVHSNTNIWKSIGPVLTFGIPVQPYTHTIFIGNQNIFVANGRHLTWIDDNNLWGTGDFSEMVQSTNAGGTWNQIRTAFPIGLICKAAHFYSQTGGFYSESNKLLSTTNSGISGTLSDSIPSPEEFISAVWTSISTTCYKLLNCAGKPFPIIVTDDLSAYVNQYIQFNGECFFVLPADDCLNSITLFPQGVPQLPVFPTCEECKPPTCYELRDCTGQTPVIVTSDDLAQYVGQVVKICDFLFSPVLSINHTSNSDCGFVNIRGFVTQVTGPTSGFFFDVLSATILPYSNPLATPLQIGDDCCFTPASPYTLVAVNSTVIYQIQFFVGTTAITNLIPISTLMTQAVLQYFINQNIIDPSYTITINYFNFAGLNVNIVTTSPITDTTATVTITPDFQGQSSVTTDVIGGCICYTVVSTGPCLGGNPLPNPISGAFPNCECCLPPPPPEPEPPYIPTPPEIDKHTYYIQESECDIIANKTFANAMYDIFKTEAYGMESCCSRNFDKIWIQKELSDQSKLKC